MSVTIAYADAAVRAAGCKCTTEQRVSNWLQVCEPKCTVMCTTCARKGSWLKDDPNAKPADAARPIDWKDHFLIGLRTDGGSDIMARWAHTPIKADIDAITSKADGYLQFTVVNPTGIISVDKSTRA